MDHSKWYIRVGLLGMTYCLEVCVMSFLVGWVESERCFEFSNSNKANEKEKNLYLVPGRNILHIGVSSRK